VPQVAGGDLDGVAEAPDASRGDFEDGVRSERHAGDRGQIGCGADGLEPGGECLRRCRDLRLLLDRTGQKRRCPKTGRKDENAKG
jgi:hypothetical protein